jgi:UrcA family protein
MQHLAVGVFISALVLAAPDVAAAQAREPQVEVDLSGIDLTTDAGADHALRRIRNAARMVCGVRGGLQPYTERAAARECAREAIEQAVDDLGSPFVSERLQRSRLFAEAARRS